MTLRYLRPDHIGIVGKKPSVQSVRTILRFQYYRASNPNSMLQHGRFSLIVLAEVKTKHQRSVPTYLGTHDTKPKRKNFRSTSVIPSWRILLFCFL